MKRVIVESPYAGNVARNVAYAKRALLDCVLVRGEAPIASHLLFTQPDILDDNLGGDRAKGIAAGIAWHAVAHTIVFYEDYGWSQGMLAAKQECETNDWPMEIRRIGPNP